MNAPWPSHLRAIGQQCLDVSKDMEGDALSRSRIVLRDKDSQGDKIGDRLRRPDRGHGLLEAALVVLPGAGFSACVPQEATQSLTS